VALSGELMLVGTENSVSLSLLSKVANWAIFRPSGTENNTSSLKCAARGSLKIQDAKKSPKIVIWAPLHNFVRLYLRN